MEEYIEHDEWVQRRHPRKIPMVREAYVRQLTPGREAIILNKSLDTAMAVGEILEVIPESMFYPETEWRHDYIVAIKLPKWGIRYVLWNRVIPL